MKIQPTGETEQYRFTAALLEEKDIRVEAEGTLQSWEGTSTRFQGQASFPGYDVPEFGCIVNLMICLCACSFLPMFMQGFMARTDTQYGDQIGFLMILFFLIGGYFVVSTLMDFQAHHNRRLQLLNTAITT